MEDDITASTVVPAALLENLPEGTDKNLSLKFAQNCEQRLFQRPGRRDSSRLRQAGGKRISSSRTISFPTTSRSRRRTRKEMVEDALGFNQFTEPMQNFVREVAETGAPDYFVCTASPRLVDGKPTKNPRYLQKRPDLVRAERNVSGGNFRAPAPPRAAGPAAAHARHRRAAGPPQQPAGHRHPRAGVLQPDSFFRAAGIVHGSDLQHDRQIAVHHRRGFRRRADQRPVQRAAADH